MSTFQVVLWIVGLNAGLMGWMLLARERQIAGAWRRFRATLDLDRSRPLLDRCHDLLMSHYGADTFAEPQFDATPIIETIGPGRYQELAAIAGRRWQVTLPTIQFRLVPADRPQSAGSFGMARTCGATIDARRMVTMATSEVHEIGLAGELLTDADALAIVVAHEVAHLVLWRDGVTTGDRDADEILADVATALVGYGSLMRRLRSRTVRRSIPGRLLGWSISGPGYLHPEELDHVLARSAQIRSSSY